MLTPTIFHEPWWMKLATRDDYGEATVSTGGKMIGRMPYVLTKRRFGLNSIGMPLMSHVLGPALLPEFSWQNFPKNLKQVAITREMIAQLPKAAHVSFRLHGGVTDTLAFGAAGFSTDASFTVEIPPDTPEKLWKAMRDKTRNVIRRAEERLTTGELLDVKQFLDFYEANLRDRAMHNHYDREICEAIIRESIVRDAGRLIVARDPLGNMQAAIFTVWDQQMAYYFMSSRTVDSMNGATSLLIWIAIQEAAKRNLSFDMDIFHIKRDALPNMLLITGFGGVVKPRFLVRRAGPVIQLAQCINRMRNW